MANIVGIDLGTTFSAVARLDETGRPVIVHNLDGGNVTPSIVSFAEGLTRPIVGQAARKELGKPWVYDRFKRDMGSRKEFEYEGTTLTPTQLSAIVLKKILNDTVAQIGEVAEAVVTIPANFANEAREATLEAAREAGLNIKYIINEPTAAALYYAFKNSGTLFGTYAVYDLGGGTFDISIVKVDGNDVEILASNGIARLGGKDFDKKIIQLIAKKYENQTGEMLAQEDFGPNEAEAEKITLSTKEKTITRVVKENIIISRSEFNELISAEIAQTELLCESTLAEAKLKPEDIKKVLLVGGSTRIPAIRESVRKVFKSDPESSVNVDEVVALGAALYTALKSDKSLLSNMQKASISKLQVKERTGKCFGTLSVHTFANLQTEQLRNSIIIQKNTPIPASSTRSFFTRHDNQTAIDCDITESVEPETDPAFVKIIGKHTLKLPPNRSAGKEIQITFSYDENQVMHCTFLDVESGFKTETDIKMANAKNSGALDKFIIE
jgi:molecular chaperone DnaK